MVADGEFLVEGVGDELGEVVGDGAEEGGEEGGGEVGEVGGVVGGEEEVGVVVDGGSGVVGGWCGLGGG